MVVVGMVVIVMVVAAMVVVGMVVVNVLAFAMALAVCASVAVGVDVPQ